MTPPAPVPRTRRRNRPSGDPRVLRSVRAGYRTAIGAIAMLLLLIPALPASAATQADIGDVYSPQGLSVPLEILLFVGVPVLGFVIGGLLSFRPAKGTGQRYRPGRPWTHEPVWFGDESALEYEPKRAALPGAGGANGSW